MLRNIRAMRVVLLVGVVLGGAGLMTLASAEPGSSAASKELPGPSAASKEPAKLNVEALLRRADEISVQVAALRGLPLKKPVKRGFMQTDAIRARVLQRIDEEQTPAELASEELLLKRWGLIAPEVDYKKLAIELLTEQIAGFYDPQEKQLYITESGEALGAGTDDMLMAHELDHALQDQHFDLRAFMKAVEDNADALMARQALVEGDGMVLMLEYLFRQAGMVPPWSDPATMKQLKAQMSGQAAASSGQNVFDSAPLVLREGLVFPYMAGFGFVAHIRKLHRWSAVDAVYKKPPLGTEHVLHPEKYDVYERPDTVKARELSSLAGYGLAYDNVYGELGLRVILQQHLGAGPQSSVQATAERAAAGWGGDRLALYVPPGHGGGLSGAVSVSYSVWDAEADAIEFFEALTDAMPSLSRGNLASESESRIEYRDAAGSVSLAERKGDAVVVIVGVDAARADAVLAEVWKRWKASRR